MTSQKKSLWEQLREARGEDPYEEQEATERLRWEREKERNAELPHPVCCPEGRRYVFPYRVLDGYEVQNDGVPVWKLSFGESWRNEESTTRHLQVFFCPFCGQRLPEMVKKKTPPPYLTQEGDYRCGRCNERYGTCWCSLPESAYEIVSHEK